MPKGEVSREKKEFSDLAYKTARFCLVFFCSYKIKDITTQFLI